MVAPWVASRTAGRYDTTGLAYPGVDEEDDELIARITLFVALAAAMAGFLAQGSGRRLALAPLPQASKPASREAEAQPPVGVSKVVVAPELVRVEALQPPRLRAVTLDADGEHVSGRVLDPDGRPVSGAEIVTYSEWPGYHGDSHLTVQDQARSAADGSFRVRAVRRIMASGILISVRVTGHASWHGVPTAFGGDDDIRLPASRWVHLQLRFDDGAPMAGARVRQHVAEFGEHGRAGRDLWPWFELGETDASGVVTFPWATDAAQPLLQVEHPDHRSRVRLPPLDGGGHAELVLTRDRALEVTWVGDVTPYEQRGLSWPRLSLAFVGAQPGHPDEAGPPHWPWFQDGATVRFEHIPDELVELQRAWTDEPLADPMVVPVGRTRLEIPLPPPEPFEPPESRWAFRARLVVRGDGLERRPRVILRDANGKERALDLPLDGEWKTCWGKGFVPPVSLVVPEWGAQAPQVHGVQPGDNVDFVIDMERVHQWSVALRVDTTQLDAERLAEVSFNAELAGSQARVRSAPGSSGLPPGRWSYRVRGAGVESMYGEVDLAVGDAHVVVARPAPWPDPEPDPREISAWLGGTVTLHGDPWTKLTGLRLRPVSHLDDGVEPLDQKRGRYATTTPLDARGGGFARWVQPGAYRIEATLLRDPWPAETVASAKLERTYGERLDVVVDAPSQVELRVGEERTLELHVTAPAPRGRLRIRVLEDGEPASATVGRFAEPTPFDIEWRGHDGTRAKREHSLLDGVLDVFLPPGPGTLTLTKPHGHAAQRGHAQPGPVQLELTVPPPRDAHGEPQALAFSVDLRTTGE